MNNSWKRLYFQNFTNYLPIFCKHDLNENRFVIYLTDLIKLYSEEFDKDDLVLRFKSDIQLKKNIETLAAEVIKLIEHISDIKNYDHAELKINNELSICSQNKSFNCVLLEKDSYQFAAYVTLPLFVTFSQALKIYDKYIEQPFIKQLFQDNISLGSNFNNLNKLLVSKSEWKRIKTSPKKRIKAMLRPVSISEIFANSKKKIFQSENKVKSNQPSDSFSTTDDSEDTFELPNKVQIKGNKYFVHSRKRNQGQDDTTSSSTICNAKEASHEVLRFINLSLPDPIRSRMEEDSCINATFSGGGKDVDDIFQQLLNVFTETKNIRDLEDLTILKPSEFKKNSVEKVKISPGKHHISQTKENDTNIATEDEMQKTTFEGGIQTEIEDIFELNARDQKKEKDLVSKRRMMLKELLAIDEERRRLKQAAKLKREKEHKVFKI